MDVETVLIGGLCAISFLFLAAFRLLIKYINRP